MSLNKCCLTLDFFFKQKVRNIIKHKKMIDLPLRYICTSKNLLTLKYSCSITSSYLLQLRSKEENKKSNIKENEKGTKQ